MVLKALIALIITVIYSTSFSVKGEPQRITLAVGHDHSAMLAANYPIYRANWEFIRHSLVLLGYEVTANPVPWARAKHLTQIAKSDGLFIAANFPGREKWAVLSNPIGYGIFGGFYHIDRKEAQDILAAVRLGDHDEILSNFHTEDLLQVATAQEGFKLLFNHRVDRLIMSESYGNYLLDTELSHFREKLRFDPTFFEKRSLHIAFAKDNPRSLNVLKIVNQAIKLGFEKGLYRQAMEHYKVPARMRFEGGMD